MTWKNNCWEAENNWKIHGKANFWEDEETVDINSPRKTGVTSGTGTVVQNNCPNNEKTEQKNLKPQGKKVDKMKEQNSNKASKEQEWPNKDCNTEANQKEGSYNWWLFAKWPWREQNEKKAWLGPILEHHRLIFQITLSPSWDEIQTALWYTQELLT